MKRHVLICGVVGGAMIALLRWMDYQFLIMEHSTGIYAALVAITFAGFGIWLGVRLIGPRERVVVREARAAISAPDERRRKDLGITPREMEILELVAQGLSNREIGERLFVSENTVKTHCSRAFDKLGAKRRTQAVQMGKELGLLR